jgi:Transcriptional regulatory protein, C terminal
LSSTIPGGARFTAGLTRDGIMDQLWGADYVAGSNVVDRHIHNLRVKLQNHYWTNCTRRFFARPSSVSGCRSIN